MNFYLLIAAVAVCVLCGGNNFPNAPDNTLEETVDNFITYTVQCKKNANTVSDCSVIDVSVFDVSVFDL